MLLNTHVRRAAASDMAHSAACSSSASQSSPTRRSFAETPHQPRPFGKNNIVYRSFQPSFEMPVSWENGDPLKWGPRVPISPGRWGPESPFSR